MELHVGKLTFSEEQTKFMTKAIKIESEKILKKELSVIETKLDLLNGELGTKTRYCFMCGTTKYNSRVGLIHEPDCLIQEIRNKLKRLDK